MKKHLYLFELIAVLSAFAILSCTDSKFDEQPQLPPIEEDGGKGEIPVSGYDEPYRPLIHYTPAKNWVNDPNGMVYVDGVYHLFYQYNPQGNEWGNLSWGHATSTDLIKWKEQPVALTRDELGDIFSGSAVYDKNNTAGFGTSTIVAIYTSSAQYQQQSLAYSTDGQTFTKYTQNPIIANSTEPDFRDPKVFWHEESQRWIMALAMGWKYAIEFWSSPDLKNWTRLSSFSTDIVSCNRGQWECPDLLRMEYNGKEKWVLIVSVNPGGPVSGSGIQYFIGDFDGRQFVADSYNYPLWLDYGMDNYAGVTWSNTANRTILIGWMNNWNYAGVVPTSPWRSAMTLPRELKLIEYDGKPLLANTVVREIETIAGEWQNVTSESLNISGPYQLRLEIDITKDGTFSLANESGEYLEIFVSATTGKLVTRRTGNTGLISFASNYAIPTIKSPFNTEGDKIILDIFVDQSSVEIFTQNGSMAQTNLIFPRSIYNRLQTTDMELKAQIRPLDNIWM